MLRLLAAIAILLVAAPAFAVAPTVTTVDPANAATGISTGTRVHVTFDQAMDANTLTTSTCQITLSGVPITAMVIWRPATNSVTIRPLGQLTVSTVYGVKITTGATNTIAEPLASEFTSTFTTSATYAGGTYIWENVTIGPNVTLD